MSKNWHYRIGNDTQSEGAPAVEAKPERAPSDEVVAEAARDLFEREAVWTLIANRIDQDFEHCKPFR